WSKGTSERRSSACGRVRRGYARRARPNIRVLPYPDPLTRGLPHRCRDDAWSPLLRTRKFLLRFLNPLLEPLLRDRLHGDRHVGMADAAELGALAVIDALP